MLKKLIYFLPLLLPLAIYALWFWAVAVRRANAQGQAAPSFWDSAPFVWLLAIGAVLTALALGVWGLSGGVPADQMGDGILERPGVGQGVQPSGTGAAGGY